MKRLNMMIVDSTMYPGLPSLRPAEGGFIREAIKEAGFEPGDDAVLIPSHVLDALLENQDLIDNLRPRLEERKAMREELG